MPGWRLLRHHRCGPECGWGALGGLAMGRADWVGLAASLMFAGRDRSRALRSKLPQTRSGYAWWGHRRNGDRCCSGGRPAHGEGLACSQPGGDGERDRGHGSGVGGVGFGPQEPGEFSGDCGDDDFAVGLAGVESVELAAQSPLGGPGSGDGVGMDPFLAFAEGGPDRSSGLVGPGCFDELGAEVDVAGVSDPAPVLALTAGPLRGSEPGEGHEHRRGRETPPVTDLAGQGQPAQGCDPPVGGEPGHRIGERGPLGPGQQVGLDRGHRGLAGRQRGPVVVERFGQGPLVETLGVDPGLVFQGPVGPAPPDPAMA